MVYMLENAMAQGFEYNTVFKAQENQDFQQLLDRLIEKQKICSICHICERIKLRRRSSESFKIIRASVA